MAPEGMVNLKHATVLITGASQGIGFGLAQRFLNAGSTVIITGRSQEKLNEAISAVPGLHGWVNDISVPEDRIALAERIRSEFPSLGVLINNAGIQRRIAHASDEGSWPERQKEIDTLLGGPVHLNALLIPTLLERQRPGLIVNVTSGGAFIPQVFAPTYSACKAAVHSYTVTLRHALRGTPIRVVELIPPAVQTGLAGPGATHGAPLNEFCDTVFEKFTDDVETIGFGPTDTPEFKELVDAPKKFFEVSANRFPIKTYSGQKEDK